MEQLKQFAPIIVLVVIIFLVIKYNKKQKL